jgi:hypothetical protein
MFLHIQRVFLWEKQDTLTEFLALRAYKKLSRAIFSPLAFCCECLVQIKNIMGIVNIIVIILVHFSALLVF